MKDSEKLRCSQVTLERLVIQKMLEKTEHDCLMFLTGGIGLPEPTTFPPKIHTGGILRTKNIA